MKEKELYPLSIVKDRYNGTYSKGTYTAWNLHLKDVPQDIEDEVEHCRQFWDDNTFAVGLGGSANEAAQDLYEKLNALKSKFKVGDIVYFGGVKGQVFEKFDEEYFHLSAYFDGKKEVFTEDGLLYPHHKEPLLLTEQEYLNRNKAIHNR